VSCTIRTWIIAIYEIGDAITCPLYFNILSVLSLLPISLQICSMSQLTSIINFCGTPNLGSLQRIEYALVAQIEEDSFAPIISGDYNWQKEIFFSEGDWLIMPVLPTKRRWEEKGNRGKHGPYYEQLVNATMPNLRPAVSGELDRMAHRKFILRLTDRNGRKWLLGSPSSPFLFQVLGTTGDSNAGLNSYAIRFYSKSDRKMTGYVPVF